MKFRTRWMMVPALLLSTLAGCSLGDDDSFQRQNLQQARTRWDTKDVASYSYILELQCFCAPASQLSPVLVTVQNGAVASLQYWDEDPEDRTPAPASVFGPYDTVEELFDFIADAISRSATGRPPQVRVLGTPIEFIQHGKPDQILADLGLDGPGLAHQARQLVSALRA